MKQPGAENTPGPSAQADPPQWAQDFPINTDQDNYVARRDFTKFMVLTSFAFVVGQCWIGIQNILRGHRPKPGKQAIARFKDGTLYRLNADGSEAEAVAGSSVEGSSISFDYPAEHDSCLLIRRAEKDASRNEHIAGRVALGNRLNADEKETGELNLVAYGQKCTHLSCPVRPSFEEGRFLCPCHEGCFDMATGRPLEGPPRRPLPIIRLTIENGTVYATGVEERTV